jgi:dihydrofolate reductase
MTSQASRKMIAALQVTLDGFVQGREGEQDWADSWASALGLIPDVDMFVLGAGMYPDYGEYWKAILESPDRFPPFQERLPSQGEIAYARKAVQTPHVVLSTKLSKVAWPPNAQIVRTVAELRTLKGQPGKNTYVVGGATFVASLLNEGLIDELRLIVHPVVLGRGRGLFDGINKRLSLDLVEAESTESGRLIVSYRTREESKATRIVKSIAHDRPVVEPA